MLTHSSPARPVAFYGSRSSLSVREALPSPTRVWHNPHSLARASKMHHYCPNVPVSLIYRGPIDVRVREVCVTNVPLS